MSFKEYNLSNEIMRSIEKMNFKEPTPVQAQTMAPMIEKRDLLVQSPTGSGKTCAFGIPVVETIQPHNRKPQSIILCPTRELALQTTAVLHNLTMYKNGVRIVALYGGEPIGRQISALRKQPQIIVATPGRLMDHIQRRTINLNHIGLVVLDEADRMLDMGFREDMDTILANVPKERQTVLFSATLSPAIREVAKSYQSDAQTIKIEQDVRTVDAIKQFYTEVAPGNKTPVLEQLLKDVDSKQVLIFAGTKAMTDKLAERLVEVGLQAEALHGGLKQSQRDRVMKRFRHKKTQILVATDVAARGIDVYDMGAVINYDIPATSDDYVHRIGRTGRANQSGIAHTLLYVKERRQLQLIMRETKAKIEPAVVEGAELPVSLKQRSNFSKKKPPFSKKKSYAGKNKRRSRPAA